MKRTLLTLVVVGLAALIGGAVKEDRITILETKVLRLPVPTQGYQPFTRGDVVFISDKTQLVDPVVETREIVFVCAGAYMVRINLFTGAARFGRWPNAVRTGAAKIDEHSIVVGTDTGGTMRIDRDTKLFTLWSRENESKGIGTCRVVP